MSLLIKVIIWKCMPVTGEINFESMLLSNKIYMFIDNFVNIVYEVYGMLLRGTC